jgi:hypothetical protein
MNVEGLFWLITVAGGAIVLGVAIAYSIVAWRQRNRVLDRRREAATMLNYKAEEPRERRKSAG